MEHVPGDLLCQHCGYNLRGLPCGSTCPECGRSTPMPRVQQRVAIDVDQIDSELDAREAEGVRQRRIDDLLTAWEARGQRVDALLDQLTAVLKRYQ